MERITRIGMDTSQRFFQLPGVDAKEQPVLRRQLTRAQGLPFSANLPPPMVAMEAHGATHHWSRALTMPRLFARRRAGRTCASCRRRPRTSRRP